MCCTCCMILSFHNLLCSFMNHVTCDYYCDHIIWYMTAWSCHFNFNPSSKNGKIKNKIKKENKNKKENKKKLSLLLSALIDGSYDHIPHNISINNPTFKQRLCLKSSLININNRHNKLLPFFFFFNEELNLENWLIDSFSDRFSFYPYLLNIKGHIKNLNDITFKISSNLSSSIIISNTSIKNYVATSILYIYLHNKPVIKMIYRAVNITTTEAKLFTIWCSINQVVGITNINHIVVIINSLYTAKRIFDSLSHPYQTHSVAISHELRDFFLKNDNNHIEFWDCPSKLKWPLHTLMDKDSKSFNSVPIFLYKSSWDFCKKWKCDSVLSQWKIFFQVADLKGKNFLELLDTDLNPIEPLTI